MAFGTEAASDGIELFLFLFEIIDIGKDRTSKDNEEKKQKIYSIDGSLLKWYSCEAL